MYSVHTHYRLMMGLTALTLRSLKSSVMVRLYLTIFELHTICAAFYVILVMVRLYLTIFDYIRIAHNLLAFYVILAIGLALSIFSIIVNALLIHGVRKVKKHILCLLLLQKVLVNSSAQSPTPI